MKVCIIGGSGHYRYVLEGLGEAAGSARLLGFAPGSAGEDLSKLRAMLQAADLGTTEHAQWQTMLDELKPDVVAVNPQFADAAAISLACIARGIHVFSEKPVATELADLALLRQALAAHPVQFAAMFGLRYQPAFLAAHAAIQAGRIGEVRMLNAQKSYKLGKRPPFFTQRARYGGTIPWVGSHAIDWVRWLSGGLPFLSVFAQQSSRHNQDLGELEVTAQCQFGMAQGVLAQVNLDYLRPESAPTHGDDRIRVVGTKGVLEVRHGVALLDEAGQTSSTSLPLPDAPSVFADFLAQCRGEGRCLISAEDSLAVTEASLLARQSADEGRLLHFPE